MAVHTTTMQFGYQGLTAKRAGFTGLHGYSTQQQVQNALKKEISKLGRAEETNNSKNK